MSFISQVILVRVVLLNSCSLTWLSIYKIEESFDFFHLLDIFLKLTVFTDMHLNLGNQAKSNGENGISEVDDDNETNSF